MVNELNNVNFSELEWGIMRYLYNREASSNTPVETAIANYFNIDIAYVHLTLAKMFNDGWLARVIDLDGNETYTISLESFEYMKARHRS